MIKGKTPSLWSCDRGVMSVSIVKLHNSATHGVGLVFGRAPGLPKVLIVTGERQVSERLFEAAAYRKACYRIVILVEMVGHLHYL